MTTKPVSSICLIGAGFSTGNYGVRALASGTILSIRHCFPNASIFIIDYGKKEEVYSVPVEDGIANVELMTMRYTKYIFLKNSIIRLLLISILNNLPILRKLTIGPISKSKVLSTIIKSDFICSIAGGDSFSDIYGFNRLIYVTLPQVLILLLRKKLVQLPQTYGPFKKTFSRRIAGMILRKSANIYARDFESLSMAKNLVGGNKKNLRPEFAYDMGFALPAMAQNTQNIEQLIVIKRNSPLIGFNISGLLYIGGYNRRNMFGIKSDYKATIFSLIDYFIEKHKAHILLVPHVVGHGPWSEGDNKAITLLMSEINQKHKAYVHNFNETLNHHSTKYVIGMCDFFLGSRMHACIAALSQMVPTVGLSYSKKFSGVFNSLNREIPVADLRSNQTENILEIVNYEYTRRDHQVKLLSQKIPQVLDSVKNFFLNNSFLL